MTARPRGAGRAVRRRVVARVAAALALVLLVTALPDAGTSRVAEALLPQEPTELGQGFHNWSDDTGVSIRDGNVHVWGNTSAGRDGRMDVTDPATGAFEESWPRRVEGLPEGQIVSVAATQWHAAFAALDRSGHVWMWGVGTADSPAGSCPARPFQVRLGAWDDSAAPLLTGVRLLTASSNYLAVITESGEFLAWPAEQMEHLPVRGPCQVSGAASGAEITEVRGKDQVGGAWSWTHFALTGEHRAVSLRGGWLEIFVVLEDGRVLVAWDIQRIGDDGTSYGGSVYDWGLRLSNSADDGLDAWTRDNSPDAYVVAVDGGYDMGGALLSDGSVLTWGRTEQHAARPAGSRTCLTLIPVPGTDPGAHCPTLNRSGVLATAKIVAIRFGKTSAVMVDDQGNLIGYSADGQRRQGSPADQSVVCLPQWPDGGHTDPGCGTGTSTVPGVVYSGVESVSSGAQFIYWRDRVSPIYYTGLGMNASHVLGTGPSGASGALGPTTMLGLDIRFDTASPRCDSGLCWLDEVHPDPVTG